MPRNLLSSRSARRRSPAFPLLLAVCLAAAGVAIAATGGAAPSVSPADETALRELKEVLWPRAYREADVELLDRILADEFQVVDAEGNWSDKRGELAALVGRPWVNRAFRFEIRRLEVFENGTAVVAGRGVALGPESDPDGGYQYQSSNILVRRDGRWQAIASHVSGVRPLNAAELAAERATAGLPTPGCAPTSEARTAWLALAEREFEIGDDADRQQRALALVDCLGDRDPQLRDGVAFTGLSTWLRAGAIDEATRLALAERLLPLVAAPEDAAGFRRSFAALALSEVARADRIAPALPADLRQRVVEAAAQFLSSTRDHRGFDPVDGWRHAVAHGADLVLQLGLHPAATAGELRQLFDALASQVAPVGVAYQHGEPDRLARAVFFLHARGLLDDAFWDGWFARLGDPAPLAGWGAAYESADGLARRHDLLAFLHAVGFAARANPSAASERLAALADRELLRLHGG